jgi:glycine/D-amino acid oxidase-like deaminating enzyme
MTRVDLTIRGGGIFGLSVAWEAVLRGAKVRLVESHHIGAGASGGLVGALTPHTPEGWNPVKAFQLQSLLRAADWWAGVEAVSGLSSGYGRIGRLQPLEDAQAVTLAHTRAEGAAQVWQGQAVWQVVAATGGDWEPATPSGQMIHDTLSARINPKLALASLAEALRAKGAQIVLGEAQDEGAVIWATGAEGLAALSQDLGQAVGRGVKGQAVLLRLSGYETRPQLFIDGLHIVPHADGTIAIGSTTENQWADLATDGQCDTLIDRARAALPVLCHAPEVSRWAGLRPRAASRGPLIGAWPNRAGQFVVNGGFKIGFGTAIETARLICDLVLEGKDTIPDAFRP